MLFNNIHTPTLLLDQTKCLKNIQRMVDKAKTAKVSIRPHFKTHQSHEVGRWFRAAGVQQITVSSLRMAEYFNADGWEDITVAFPINIREIDRINELAQRIQLNLIADQIETIQFLKEKLQSPIGIWIKINLGNQRVGFSPTDLDAIRAFAKDIKAARNLHLRGLLGHAGQSYGTRNREDLDAVHTQSITTITHLQSALMDEFPDLSLSIGDTPTCSTASTFPGIDEIRPGNFVFYDLTQWEIGACQLEDIAVAMACPVVAKYPDRKEMVVYGGGIHFSKDRLTLANGTTIFGLAAPLYKTNWATPNPAHYVRSLSQEHGVIKASPDFLAQYEIGDLMAILPVHSCMNADLMRHYKTLEGQNIQMMAAR